MDFLTQIRTATDAQVVKSVLTQYPHLVNVVQPDLDHNVDVLQALLSAGVPRSAFDDLVEHVDLEMQVMETDKVTDLTLQQYHFLKSNGLM